MSRETVFWVRDYMKNELASLDNALTDVRVAVGGGSILVDYSMSHNWRIIIEKTGDMPDEMNDIFANILKVSKLSLDDDSYDLEQAQLIWWQIDELLDYLQVRFPKAGVRVGRCLWS